MTHTRSRIRKEAPKETRKTSARIAFHNEGEKKSRRAKSSQTRLAGASQSRLVRRKKKRENEIRRRRPQRCDQARRGGPEKNPAEHHFLIHPTKETKDEREGGRKNSPKNRGTEGKK